ncbi:MAG: hypothetical protein ACE5IR_20250 [bacterium]
MAYKDDPPISIFPKIHPYYRPEERQFEPERFADFIKQYDGFLTEFDLHEVKKVCEGMYLHRRERRTILFVAAKEEFLSWDEQFLLREDYP